MRTIGLCGEERCLQLEGVTPRREREVPAAQRQTCKVCMRPDKFDFSVPDNLWARIVPSQYQNRVVCLYCFDDFAFEGGIDYADHLHGLYFAGDRAVFKFKKKWGLSL